jgi:hypothetical protein
MKTHRDSSQLEVIHSIPIPAKAQDYSLLSGRLPTSCLPVETRDELFSCSAVQPFSFLHLCTVLVVCRHLLFVVFATGPDILFNYLNRTEYNITNVARKLNPIIPQLCPLCMRHVPISPRLDPERPSLTTESRNPYMYFLFPISLIIRSKVTSISYWYDSKIGQRENDDSHPHHFLDPHT